MDYHGKFQIFDTSRIRTYELASRPSKVTAESIPTPEEIAARKLDFESADLDALVAAVHEARKNDQPVIVFTGAHLIKNGFGPLLLDLIRRGLVTLVGMNAAGMIHDYELARVGRTSEDVPHALPRGKFGFAKETGDGINEALTYGEKVRVGAGEALARLIHGEPFPEKIKFAHPDLSLLAGAFEFDTPVTMHASIGCDIIDQFPGWDPSAKGGCSGRDFLIFCHEVEKMSAGGVFLNIGSAVSGPEVFLKACSMCANVGYPPMGLVTGSFDFREGHVESVNDERSPGYYHRDIKSVVVRIPEAFGGNGYYVRGDHLVTLPALYQRLIQA